MKEGVPGEVIVTFGEAAGKPGSADLLSMVADDVLVTSTVNSTSSDNVDLTTRHVGISDAELVGTFDVTPPFRLQLSALFGIHSGSLLKYTSSADVVTTQTDWWDVQDWGMQSGLEITIRDPYTNQAPGLGYGGLPGDQCQSGYPFEGGDACVMAVVRFGGELLNADMNVTTFAGDGHEISTTLQPARGYGVVILKVPLNISAPYTEVFAKVNYRQAASGEYDGQAYDVVDHWATTYARIVRASDNGEFIV